MTIRSEKRSNEPLAIIGIGCHFPGGAYNPDRFWKLLVDGVDAIVDVPEDRWDFRKFYDPDTDKLGKMHAKQAGFLQEKVNVFDPLFFGMSPREAACLDPQQRFLLEVTWEAIEDAGLLSENLKESDTGVFIGGFNLDNKLLRMGVRNRELMNSYSGTSSTMVLLSNRISYAFDLRGPSVSMDTACSSSLISAHYACQSIWNGECDMAISGGVNVMLLPEYPITMSKGHFLSKHSRCKAFDEDAGGYVRGEGAGVLIIKPLSKAQKDRDFIYATIKATGVNQDGATNGISFPNPKAQESLIREVYAQAGVKGHQITYVEAHGTGTQAGDPIEIAALNAVLSEGRKASSKVVVGSVKTNIGHTEAAAGVAGLIKTALTLKNEKIVPHLHFIKANPKINFDELCLRIPTEIEDYKSNGKLRMASVNSFGYGGTNGHALLEEAPATEEIIYDENDIKDHQYLIPLSARSEGALKELAASYADFIKNNTEITLRDFAHSAVFRRSKHHYRLTVSVQSMVQLVEQMEAYARGDILPGMMDNQGCVEQSPQPVFVCTGMGSQWWGMGQQLYKKEAAYRETVQECNAIFQKIAGWSILDEMNKDEASSQMEKTAIAQPANFVIQAGLFALWKSWGVRPAAIVGHSVGEVAAAYLSGALSLEDAMLVSYHRSRLQQTTAGRGKMLAIGLPETQAADLIGKIKNVSIAAINSPSSVTLAGEESALLKVSDKCSKQEIFNKMLRVEVAYHSYQMDPIKDELLDVLSGVTPKNATIPMYSTVEGKLMVGTELDASYWWQNVRQPVRFAKVTAAIIDDGYKTFLEVGPHPVLKPSISEVLAAKEKKGQLLMSLRRNEPEVLTVYAALGAMFGLGYAIDWQALTPQGDYIKLPTYPWQRESYWNETEQSREERLGAGGHVFLYENKREPEPAWEVELNQFFFPFISDHQVGGMIVFPGAAYVEAGLALHEKEFDGKKTCTLENLKFHNVLVVDSARVQVMHTRLNTATNTYSVYSRFKEEGSDWMLHATGKMLDNPLSVFPPEVDFSAIRKRCSQEVNAEKVYDNLNESGLCYGPYFQGMKEIFTGDNEVLARVEGHGSLNENKDNYLLHPTVLDSSFQSMVALLDGDVAGRNPFVPVSMGRISFFESPGLNCWSYVQITNRTEKSIKGNLYLFDQDGNVLLEVSDLTCQAIASNDSQGQNTMANCFYEYSFNETDPVNVSDELPEAGDWLLFNGDTIDMAGLVSELGRGDSNVIQVQAADTYEKLNDNTYKIRKDNAQDYFQLFSELKNRNINHLVYGWSLDVEAVGEEVTSGNVVEATLPVVYIVQAIAHELPEEELRFSILTRDTQVVNDEDQGASLAEAPLWGLGLLASNEHPHLTVKMIDLDTDKPEDSSELLVNELLYGDAADDVALRDNKRYVKVLNRSALLDTEIEQETKVVTTDSNVELLVGTPGQMSSLHYREIERRAPGKEEIEVKVRVSSLNFKDILKVMGQISSNVIEDTYFGDALGMESSGIVTRVGESVTDHQVGDEIIFGTNGGCFKSYITFEPTYYVPKPANLNWSKTSIFVPYLTVIRALGHIANLQEGEKILIHNGTGGVGIAAIQYAKWKGAQVYSTAGSDEKRAYLKSLGVEHIYNSRDLEYVNGIMADTGGYGVDVVLNAISGESLLQSFNLLAPYGRFIEIGKKDIGENTGLPMNVFNRNITFAAIDVERMLVERTDLTQQIFREVSEGFEQGYFHSMPAKVYPAAEVVEAFSYLAQSRHMGKVVIDFHEQEVEVPVGTIVTTVTNINKDATYLITGGTGGFGLVIAKHFSKSGAGALALVSRNGAKTDICKEAIQSMEAAGTTVSVFSVDISDETAVERMIIEINEKMPPLTGIVHGAMVLDDGFLVDMDKNRFERVLNPKVAGAINLHRLTKNLPIEFFISFSSISSMIGNAGQGNYVTANAFLDAFAHYRTQIGLSATTINLGVLKSVGVVSRDRDVAKILESAGIRGFSTSDALNALDSVIATKPVQIGMFDVNWSMWGQGSHKSAASSRFRELVAASGGGGQMSEELIALIDELADMSVTDRHEYMEELIAIELAKVLSLPLDKVEYDRGINLLGVDSLMGVEVAIRLQAKFGLEISTVELISGPTITHLATSMLTRLITDEEELFAEVDELDEGELDEMLKKMEAVA